jgi:hypothetical protein
LFQFTIGGRGVYSVIKLYESPPKSAHTKSVHYCFKFIDWNEKVKFVVKNT